MIAACPHSQLGHSQFYLLGDQVWEWPGNKANSSNLLKQSLSLHDQSFCNSGTDYFGYNGCHGNSLLCPLQWNLPIRLPWEQHYFAHWRQVVALWSICTGLLGILNCYNHNGCHGVTIIVDHMHTRNICPLLHPCFHGNRCLLFIIW